MLAEIIELKSKMMSYVSFVFKLYIYFDRGTHTQENVLLFFLVNPTDSKQCNILNNILLYSVSC